MANSLTSQLNEALERLVEKTDQLLKTRPWNAEQETRLLAGYERLAEALANMEQQQKVESLLAKKIENIVPRLDKVLKKQDRVSEGAKENLAEKIERLAGTVKVIGQITEIIASSMQVISKAYLEKKTAATSPENGDEKTDTIDLTGILTQVNDLVKSVVEGRSSSDENQAITPELSYNPEAEPTVENEEKAI